MDATLSDQDVFDALCRFLRAEKYAREDGRPQAIAENQAVIRFLLDALAVRGYSKLELLEWAEG